MATESVRGQSQAGADVSGTMGHGSPRLRG